jgi:hypothetical protein
MKYTVRESVIDVLGYIWMPHSEGATSYTLSNHDVENARDDDGRLTRESVQHWLDSHAGDFSGIEDFWASLEDGNETIEIPWKEEENEFRFANLMNPLEEW